MKTVHLVLLVAMARGNWLHQCSQCVDQSLFSDMSLKTDIKSANTSSLYEQLKLFKLRQFEHVEKEFFNRFFPRYQLGLVAQELQPVAPDAVSLIPERRYTSANGTQVSTKNILMVRETHVLFTLVGGVQELGRKVDSMDADYWTRVEAWGRRLDSIQGELGKVGVEARKISDQIGEEKSKILILTQQWSGVRDSIKASEERVGELRGEVVVVAGGIAEFKRMQTERLGAVEREVMAFSLKNQWELVLLQQNANQMYAEVDKRIGDIERQVEQAVANVTTRVSLLEAKASEGKAKLTGLSSRLSNVENMVFEIHSAVFQKHPLVETLAMRRLAEVSLQRVKEQVKLEARRVRLLRELLLGRELLVDKQRAVMEQLALRRELFDKELLREKELAQVRILREKISAESAAADRQLAFGREKLSVDMAVRLEQARLESDMKLRDRRENEDVNLRELGEKNSAEKDRVLMIIRETAAVIVSWVKELYGNPDNLLLAIGSILGLVVGVYVAKEGSALLREELSRRMGKPDLVRETSRESVAGAVWAWIRPVKTENAFSDVVLNSGLMDQIRRLAMATRSGRQRNRPLLNCMFYGEPGTGKTMVAKRFAEFSGLDYAIMSGGDVAPLGADAVTQIHQLFKWVHSSRRGVVLFIDEAESFLNQRTGGMSENLRNAITAMLYHTGTASTKFMMIIATNRPGDLDTAIVDRIDESIEFPLPDTGERGKLVKMYFEKYVVGGAAVPGELEEVAKKIRGFSGREISKLMMSVHTHLEMTPGGAIGKTLLQVTDQKIAQHVKAKYMAKSGYAFDHSTLGEEKENEVLN